MSAGGVSTRTGRCLPGCGGSLGSPARGESLVGLSPRLCMVPSHCKLFSYQQLALGWRETTLQSCTEMLQTA